MSNVAEAPPSLEMAAETVFDGLGVRGGARTVREPCARVHCGPCDGTETIASNPIIVVDVVSPPSMRGGPGSKLLDDVPIRSIQHHMILYGGGKRIVRHRRTAIEGDIATRILGRGDVVGLPPPAFSVTVDAYFDG